jgi:hypothetical protein
MTDHWSYTAECVDGRRRNTSFIEMDSHPDFETTQSIIDISKYWILLSAV